MAGVRCAAPGEKNKHTFAARDAKRKVPLVAFKEVSEKEEEEEIK